MLLDLQYSKVAPPHYMATSQLTIKQNIWLKSSIVDINHCLNKVLLAFNTLNSELKPGQCLADLFPDHFSFNTVKFSDPNARRVHLNKLNKVYFTSLSNDNTILVIADAGYHKWPLTDFVIAWFDNQSVQKAKLDKQQKMLLSLRFILRHTVLKYMIVCYESLE